ncbi:MAG: hypothetical protein WA622_15440 [Mycobacterium sp.]|uniref:hypothetical protein n=1 Tax=Mycobacterium sp. TaxID=1785 RepID=UPI003BB7C48E
MTLWTTPVNMSPTPGLAATHHPAALDAVTGCAARAHALATGDTMQNRVMQLTRRAFRSWRDVAGLDNASLVDQAAVDNAARLIAAPA